MHRVTLSAVLFALAALMAARVPAASAQQPASIDVSIDRNQVTVGDRITVSVVLQLPTAAQPDLTGLEQQFGELDVLLIGLPEERPLAGDRKEVRVRYEVAAFRTGELQLPPLTVAYTLPDGTRAEVTSAPLPITVQSVIPPGADAADIRDLKPQIDLPFREAVSRRALVAVGAFVVAVLAAFGLASWWLWRRRRPVTVAPAPVTVAPTPEAAARADLDRIAGLGLLDAGDLKTYHALIGACIRRYLTDRHHFPAFAMTTSELRARMEQYGVDRWQARLTAGLLAECEAVVYAQYTPARPRAESNLAAAYEIIALTDEEAAPPAPAVTA